MQSIVPSAVKNITDSINGGVNRPVSDLPIGVFDSGIGGLTVASELHRRLPGEDILYLGDTARVPYGTKSYQTIERYALECALYLLNRRVKLLVAACNTVSSVALDRLVELLRVPIIGVLEPGIKAAVKRSKNASIGVIGTTSTIRSQAYQRGILKELPKARVYAKACPLLVPLAEEGRTKGEVVELTIRNYLSPLSRSGIDTLVLGCTHYPLFKTAIQGFFGEGVHLIDSAEAAAKEVERALLRDGILKTHGAGRVRCYFTDLPGRRNRLAKLFFGGGISEIRMVSLEIK